MRIEGPLSIRHVAPDSLTPGPERHDEEMIENLRAKVRRLGVYRPILLREDDSIGAGRGLWEAASLEGMATVPTITLKGLTDADWARLAKAEDKAAEAGLWRGLRMDLAVSQIGDLQADAVTIQPSSIAPLFRA